MQKSLWIIVLLLMVVIGASPTFADTVSEQCGPPVNFDNITGTAISGAVGPGIFTCAPLPVGAGNVISRVQLFYSAEYAFGNTPGTNTVIWRFNTGAGTWTGANTETVTGGFSSSSTTPAESAGVLDAPFVSAVVAPGQIDTSDLGVGTDTFAGVTVTAPVIVEGGVLSTTGDVFAEVTYTAPVRAPEPGTAGLMLIGVGVLLAGVMQKRKASHQA